MPGPVSDSYDPEWGTSANADQIRDELNELYARLSIVLGQSKPMYILDLIDAELEKPIQALLI